MLHACNCQQCASPCASRAQAQLSGLCLRPVSLGALLPFELPSLNWVWGTAAVAVLVLITLPAWKRSQRRKRARRMTERLRQARRDFAATTAHIRSEYGQ